MFIFSFPPSFLPPSLPLSLSTILFFLLQVQIVKALLDAGANIDAQSANGGTPLMRAIESTQRDIVKLLVDRG